MRSASYLFVMWEGGGNVNPFLGLAEALLGRRHRIGAVATASLRDRLEAAGIEVVGTPEGWLAGWQDVVTAVDRFGPDVVVVDYMLTEALCGAERAGRPTVAVVHTLYRALLVDGAPNPMEMAGPVSSVNQARAAASLPPVDSYADLLSAVDAVLVTAPEALDTPGDLPPNVAFVGSLFERAGPDAGWEPPAGDGPLVVVSAGTAGIPAVEADLLGRILEALGTLPVRGFVTVPGYIDRAALDPPANVTVSDYVRHAAVLPHADLLVSHGGLGSVGAALAHGVPIVCLPQDREQPDNARAVARIGAGAALSPAATADEIAAAISEQLRRPERVRIEADPQPAVDLLERLAGG